MTEVQVPRIDAVRHNEEVAEVWEAYRAGDPIRVPMILGSTPRFTSEIPDWNPHGITYEDVFEDPMLMLQRQIEHQAWVRHTLPQDAEWGLPLDGWRVEVNFENVYEAAWFGCPIQFEPGQIPDTLPILDDDRRNLLFDRGIPEPFEGFMGKAWAFYGRQKEAASQGWSYLGRPLLDVWPCGMYTDGPLTIACNLRGATRFLGDLAEDDNYADDLLEFVTTAVIGRLKSFRRRLGLEVQAESFGFADDAILHLSVDMYRERILPHHRRMVDELSRGGAGSMHLCGNATRHFPTIVKELNVRSFDTGFPVDHGALRRELGPEVEIAGGPSVPLLLGSDPESVARETASILDSGVMEGGLFIMREGNSLAPDTPLENLRTMYETTRRCGRYRP
ncbi:MAG TPA: uroporphyrinogen decarboxylase family protein [Fimbriimonas sp.]